MALSTNNKIIIASTLIIFLSLGSTAFGQFYFGKNKVQYTNFDWQVMETRHFRVYFYTEEEGIAKIAAQMAEDGYTKLAARFKHEIYEPIPLIIYSSPNYFSQTNVTSSLLPESVGGFTEFLKGRVVAPFNGSYYDFDHVLRHELVHVFTISKLESVMGRQRFYRAASPPLWFLEGLAEYWSAEWDSEADMILKDMVLSGRLLPISRFEEVSGTYYMYKLGQSICQFINDEYGSEKLVLILENWWKGGTFGEIVRLTVGDNLEEVSKKWEYYLRRKYYPQISEYGLINREARQLTREGYALKGVPVNFKNGPRPGEWIVFKANRMGYSGLYMMPIEGEERKLYTLIKGERSAGFESLHLSQSGIDASDEGKVIFSSKAEERDVLYVYNLSSRSIARKYEFPELISIASPRFSERGDLAVFSGADKSGIVDLYIVNLETGELKNITNDIYNDIDPTFTVRGDSVIFSSDRCLGGNKGALNLFKISVDGGDAIPLTAGGWRDINADATEEGVFFSSDREGVFNIYKLNANGDCYRITSFLTGAYDPRPALDKKSLLFSGYQDFGFHIYAVSIKDSIRASEETPSAGRAFWKPEALEKRFVKSSIQYRAEYSFDIAQSAISYDPVYGSIGGMQVALSDMLGDNAFYFLLTNTAESKDEFLSSFNVAVTYINKKRRLNWGLGIYHFYDEYYNDYEGYFYERQAGALAHMNYPLSKFNRFETTAYLRYSDKDSWLFNRRRQAFLMSNYLSFISDNSLWDITGPIEGHRFNITVGVTSALDDRKIYNRLGLIDLRQYFRLGKFSAFASRLFWFSSSGIEPQRIYFGGSWSFRGYDRREFYNRNIIFSSNELRFPLIDNLVVGFPFGGVGLQGIRGAIFFDAGSAWDDEFDQLLGSIGSGVRVALFRVIVLRFDFSQTTDFEKIDPHIKTDFFFGWNF
jgi:Tol biopolymer transport system component